MEAGNCRQGFYGPLSRPARALWESDYLAYVTIPSRLAALAGDHRLVYSSGVTESQVGVRAVFMALHTQKVPRPGLRGLEAHHQQEEP